MLKKYSKPYPTIGEIVAGKDYDYVSYRGYDEKRNYPPATGNNTDGEFCGCFKVVDGKIIPLDGDSYDDSEPVIATEEWTMLDDGIEKGLTVVVKMGFVPAGELDEYLKTYRKEKEKKMLKAVDIKWDVTDDGIDESDDEACEILESLPTEMNIPEGMTDPDEISDWLSDETGFCHDAASSRSLAPDADGVSDSHIRVQLPSDRQANKFDRGFPSVDDGFRLVDQDGNDADLI